MNKLMKKIFSFAGLQLTNDTILNPVNDFRSGRNSDFISEIPDIIMETDLNKVYTWSNKAGFEFFGYDVIGKEASIYFLGEQDTYFQVQPLFSGLEDVIYVESWQKRQDGAKRLLAWYCRSLKDEKGHVYGALSSAHDITDQNKAGIALKESEEKYKKLVELSPDGIVVHSEGKIIYVNNAAIASIGAKSAADLIGRTALDFVHPDYKQLAIQRIKNIMANNAKAELTHEKFIRLNGEAFDVETTAIPFIYEGKPSIQLIVRDISERKRIEEEKLESEIKFKTLFDSANDAIFLMDRETFIECNPMTLEMFGCTKEQIIGQPPYRFSPEFQPDGRISSEKALEKINAALKGETQAFEWVHCRYDGTLFYAEVRLNLISILGKDCLQASVRDISLRKLTEENLRKSEEKYRLLADNMNDMLLLIDLNLNVTYISPSVVKIGGYTLEEIQQIPINLRFTPDSYKLLMEIYKKELPKILSDPEYTYNGTIDLEVYHKDGSTFWLEIVVSVIHDESGQPVSILCVGRDITVHKIMSKKLKDSEERLNLFFTQSLDGFFFFMLDEPITWKEDDDKEKILDYVFEHQRITKVNKAMLDQYGATEEEFLGMTPADFFAHDIEQGRQVFKEILENGHLHIDIREKKIDGTDIIIEGDYLCLYDQDGRITGHFGIQRDVTSLRQAEKTLAESEQQLRFITNHLPVYIVQVDKELRFKFMNQPFAELFGLQPADLIGKYIPDVVGTEAYNKSKPYIDIVFSGQFTGFDIEMNFIQGDPWTASVIYVPEKNQAGTVTGFIAAITDISGRKKDEERIQRQIEELQRWQMVTLGREDRNRELKREVNDLLSRLGEPIRYPSQENIGGS